METEAAAARLALTFDAEHPDHPVGDPIANAHRLLDVLATSGVAATFFVQGAWARAFPSVVQRIVADGHLVGNHSHHHCRFTAMTNEGIAGDLELSRSILDEHAETGDRFRLPWGAGADGPDAGRIAGLLRESGYRHIGWDCGENDWKPGITAAAVATPIIDAATAGSGRVAVLHSWPDVTADAVRLIIEALRGAVDLVRIDRVG